MRYTSIPMSYSERAHHALNPVGRRLLQLMDEKQSNVALALDVTQCSQALELADLLGPEIALLKLHVDILQDYTPAFIGQLQALAQKHHFLLFEDRKFADIGSTVRAQYQGGVYRIAEWADLINAHTIAGPSTLEGLKSVGLSLGRATLLIASMSTKGALFTARYTQKTVELALTHSDFVIGFITQHKLTDEPAFIHMTPGVHLKASGDALGQGYITPECALIERCNDLIIVGRGILEAPDPLREAQCYRKRAFAIYRNRLN